MSSPLCVWSRLAIACALFLSGSLSLSAQTTFLPQGNEFKPVGALPGDQVRSAVAIHRNGGYLVWQDYYADGNALGVSAQRLDTSLTGVYTPFRLNEQGAGDQENAQVAMLADGGAVFVWQSGTRVDSDIVIRFVSSAGTFLTGDLAVNTFTTGLQQDPSITVLADGSVAVVWSSFGQDGSMQGIYGQLFTDRGQKIGGEFRVNQFATYNQRHPSVSGLKGGNLVVTWISEQQRGSLSVDAYARVINPATGPVGNEFRINDSNDPVATPVVSGTDDGGFVVAWTQRSLSIRTNSLDIYARTYSAAASPGGGAFRVNTSSYGDQYQPRITTTGAEHLIVWTTLQGTEQEDVFGRFLVNGSPSGGQFGVNTRTVSKQVQPAVAADGYGKIYCVWSSFYEGTSLDLVARRYSALRPVPQPAAPLVFAVDSTTLSVNWPSLSGFDVASYEVYVDGAAEPVVVSANLALVGGFAPGTTHSFRLAYVLADGRRSVLSGAATGTTWGVDTNGDGIPDDWQQLYWGKEGWPAADSDSDGDGASDYSEFMAGTNPLDADSVLRSRLVAAGGQFWVQWNTQPGLVYQVQSSENLRDWLDYGPPRFAVGSIDSVLTDGTARSNYYRVVRIR
jgi:hypothetical protein